MLSKENLKRAFDMFDNDHNGSITPDEIKMILGIGKRFSESVWGNLISQVNQNRDGQISFDDFEKMMNKFLE